ncbi:hypothetical protein DH86_00004306 [Scytalidium sp. 3C]|nr:hypothetical protein DH86_00004306 [Scytalidium sp. 3C]
MSVQLKRNVAVAAVAAVGGLVLINMNTPLSSRKHQNISSTISAQLDTYNASTPLSSEEVHQERRATIFDRTRLMHDAKTRKPWNMTFEEREKAKHHEHQE